MATTDAPANPRILVLFDIDGTLTVARKRIEGPMSTFLEDLKKKVSVGVVGGSDLVKAKEQLGEDMLDRFAFVFSENGLMAFKAGEMIGKQNFAEHIGEDNLKRLINFILKYLSDVDIPVKRGTFIEFRAGMLNVSPIGRACSREERNAFEAYDKEHNIRPKMVEALKAEFPELGLTYSIGGQISFDVFPAGWDKTFCLRFLPEGDYDEIHFFGDKTYPGGNDHEIYEHERTIGHVTTGPEDTIAQCTALFLDKK